MRLLHAGCGTMPLPGEFARYEEVRLDIDPAVKPHVVGSLDDLGEIGVFDAIYTSHVLEHLYPHRVPVALREFRRVLKPGGVAVIIVPDLEGLVISDDAILDSQRGPLCALDLIYGYRPDVEQSPYMAHHSGFTASLLSRALEDAGFEHVITRRMPLNLVAIAQ